MKNQREAEKAIYNVLADLKSCSKKRDLQWGRRIHAKAVENRHESNIYVATTIIRMYGKCGSMADARRMFDSIPKPDVVCWTTLLLGYVDNGEGLTSLELFSKMKACGCAPDFVTYVAALKACTSLAGKRDGDRHAECLKRGREIHSEIGFNLDIYVQNTLIDMYAKCNSMGEARQVFDSIQDPDVVSWNALLLGYVEIGDGNATLQLFSKMKALGCAPNSVTYVAAIKACAFLAGKRDGSRRTECLQRGKEIHRGIGCELTIFVRNTLIDMYAKCGSMVDARSVFESIQKPDVVAWTALLQGYAENGDALSTLELFSRMKVYGCSPDSVAFIAALKACTSLAGKKDSGEQAEWLKRGREIHSEIGIDMNMFLQSTLIDMYAKCGSMTDAHRLFESIQNPNVVCWTALLLGYAENGDALATLELFTKMKSCGCVPNSVSYLAALKACASLAVKSNDVELGQWLKRGREIHAEMDCDLDISVENTLIDMYAKCGTMADSRRVFDSIQKPNSVSWNVLLLGYVDNGDGLTALDLFFKMKALSGCAPDCVTYIAAVKACGSIGALALGRKIHLEISEFTAHLVSCLVDFYAKSGSMGEAREVFNLHSAMRLVSTWNALLAGYASFGNTVSVFNLFETMQDQGLKPDAVTFLCMLSCCSHAGLIEKAMEYFDAMPTQYGVTPTVMHYTCMVDLLGRANQLDEAVGVLRNMPCNADAVTWMTLLGACRKWKNVEVGRHAFQSLVDIDRQNASAYVFMAQIYSSRGMWEEQQKVLKTSVNLKLGSWKHSGQTCFYDELGNMVKFVGGEEDPPEVKEKLLEDKKECGYIAELFSSCSVADPEREEILCGHSERRAIAYGILKTRPGEAIRAFKNMRMCDDCHGAAKMISKVSGRVIMVKDTRRFHMMVNGSCSCGDYW